MVKDRSDWSQRVGCFDVYEWVFECVCVGVILFSYDILDQLAISYTNVGMYT